MSLFGLFDIGKSAILASQNALNVVSNNIANMNTPGYSRNEVILEVSNPVQISGQFLGRGVTTAGIRRHYDKFLHLQLIGQHQSFGKSFALEQGLGNIEQVFNEAQDLGLAGFLHDYFNAWQDVATNPERQTDRTALLQKASSVIRTAKQMEGDILNTLKFINNDINNLVIKVNSITQQISKLSDSITGIEAGLGVEKASFFRDQRDQLLYELGELIDYTWFDEPDGQITIMVAGRSLVNTENVYQLSTQFDLDGNRSIYLQGEDISSRLNDGKLGGFLAVRNDIEATPLTNLRRLIASIVKETNIMHNSGFGLDGSTNNDFFSPLQIYTRENSIAGYISSSTITDTTSLTLDEYDINFVTATSYEVYDRQTGGLVTSGSGFSAGDTISFDGIDVVIDGSLAANDSFRISPLTGLIENLSLTLTDTQQVAAASSNLNLPGDNTNALNIAGLSMTEISNLSNSTFNDYYGGIVSSVGIMSKSASDSLIYDDNLRFELEKKRDAVSGVSLDEEAVNLIRFQRAYEAGAKIIQLTDELLETIINL